MGTDDFLARVGYETWLRSCAETQPDWEHVDEATKDHWREIVRAMRMAWRCR
jgi:hypothetical protein